MTWQGVTGKEIGMGLPLIAEKQLSRQAPGNPIENTLM